MKGAQAQNNNEAPAEMASKEEKPSQGAEDAVAALEVDMATLEDAAAYMEHYRAAQRESEEAAAAAYNNLATVAGANMGHYYAAPSHEEKPSQGAEDDMPALEDGPNPYAGMPPLEDEENPYADMPPLESARQRAVEEIVAAYIEYFNAEHAASIATATHSHEEKAAAE